MKMMSLAIRKTKKCIFLTIKTKKMKMLKLKKWLMTLLGEMRTGVVVEKQLSKK
jgi:hypothetical protein